MSNTTTNDPITTGVDMQVGTLLRTKGEDKLFMITKVITVLRKKRKTTEKIKGYKVSPCDQMDWAFAVTNNELAQRFEVVS